MQRRTYDVLVKNDSAKPVTIWLTKDGPAWENGWKSPEDLAIESPKMDERISGVIVPPGKTASTGQVSGEFAPSTQAILRVYLGQRLIHELLAMDRGTHDRIDVTLKPGSNSLLVTDDGSGIKVEKQAR
ncbi:MAG TPA: hypothetical protein VHD56_07025 [Tepidisphaeraceae bacterium]|nr:hypothetical protein [Tepidisphaeraceae bacterium]